MISALHQVELTRVWNLPVAGQPLMELGSGWKPIIPLVFRMAGAEPIYMIDVSPTMDYAMLAAGLAQVRQKSLAAPDYLHKLGLQLERLPLKLPPNFQDALHCLRFIYQVDDHPYPPVSGIVSHNVLEHIPENDLPTVLHRCYQVLPPEGWMILFIDHSDHIQSHDASISPLHFLRFDDAIWRKWSVGPFHQNRLRWNEYQELLVEAGFRILVWEKDTYPIYVEEAKSMSLCRRYRSFAPEDLAIIRSRVVVKKQ